MDEMNTIEKTERYVAELLELAAVYPDDGGGIVYDSLIHLVSGVALFEQLSGDGQETVMDGLRKLQYFFCTKISLKERKRNKEKKIIPPNPLLKEKENNEKVEKNLSIVCNPREAFRNECLGFIGAYNQQEVADFYYYWTELDDRGKMRFEKQRYWNTETRLKRWITNQYSVNNASAAISLKRQKRKQSKEERASEQLEQQAEERKRNERRWEAEAEERKQSAVSYEEYQKLKNS